MGILLRVPHRLVHALYLPSTNLHVPTLYLPNRKESVFLPLLFFYMDLSLSLSLSTRFSIRRCRPQLPNECEGAKEKKKYSAIEQRLGKADETLTRRNEKKKSETEKERKREISIDSNISAARTGKEKGEGESRGSSGQTYIQMKM